MCLSIREGTLTGVVAIKLHVLRAGLNDDRSKNHNSTLGNKLDRPHIQCKIVYKEKMLPTPGMRS